MAIKSASLVPELKEALAGMDRMPEIMVGEEGIVEVNVTQFQILDGGMHLSR